MERELQLENFKRIAWTSRQEYEAERYDGGGPVCNLVARIFWRSDNNGRLTAIKGTYDVTCL